MLNKYLASDKVYNERLAICKGCEHYFKPTGTCTKCGCFMRVKAKLSNLSCPIKLWLKTSVLEKPDLIPQHLIKEVEMLWPDIKDKRAKDYKVKANMIELYNTIYQANFNINTSCSSCLKSVFDGLAVIHKTYIENE
jgi:hypothetical protein